MNSAPAMATPTVAARAGTSQCRRCCCSVVIDMLGILHATAAGSTCHDGFMPNGADRRLEVAPERIARWLTGFGERHGGVTEVTAGPDTLRYVAADGSRAACPVP